MKKTILLVATALSACSFSNAAIVDWYGSVTGTANNVVAATGGAGGGKTGAGGGGWTFNGTTGIAFDYGNLSVGLNSAGMNSGNNSFGASYGTIEYVFNLSDSGASIGLGSFNGYNNVEQYVLKLEQYNNSNQFGATSTGVRDANFTGSTSTFNQLVNATFVLNANTWTLYINGVSVGQDSEPNQWRINGGAGILGSGKNLTTDATNGAIMGVATYNRALTAGEVLANYNALAAVPEPSTYGLMGAGALAAAALVRRRRKTA